MLRAHKNQQNLVVMEDPRDTSTLEEAPDPQHSEFMRKSPIVAELLSTEPVEVATGGNSFNIAKWESDHEPTASDALKQASYSHTYRTEKVWVFKGTDVKSNQKVVGIATSKHFLQALDNQGWVLLGNKKQEWEKAKNKVEQENELRKTKEAEAHQREVLLQQQLTEQFNELTGRVWDADDFSAYGVDVKVKVDEKVDTDGVPSLEAKVVTEGSIRITYNAWIALMQNVQRMYDSMDD